MRRAALVAALTVLGSCKSTDAFDPLAGPFSSDLAAARTAWLAHKPDSYAFEITWATEWFPPGAYSGENDGKFYRVTVEAGQATEYRDASGKPVSAPATTIEQEWQRILSAQQKGTLKSASFAANGVPVEWFIDADNMADDAVRTWIRSFSPKQ